MRNNEIVIYQPGNASTTIEVRVDGETVWLNRHQIAELFDRDIKTIGKHINNALREELSGLSTVANFATVQMEGDRQVKRQIEHYNLDVIISVGYRVKSKRGVQFRVWANKVLTDHLLKGYTLNNRVNRIEDNLEKSVGLLTRRMDQIELMVNTKKLPTQGIFFNGQIYDAYAFAAELIRQANESIILIDNYIDDSVLTLLSKRNKNVQATIYTKTMTKALKLDLEKHNAQYPAIAIKPFVQSHDRFLLIDHTELYHIGASLKDLGKKWFAFSKMDSMAHLVLQQIQNVKL